MKCGDRFRRQIEVDVYFKRLLECNILTYDSYKSAITNMMVEKIMETYYNEYKN